MPSDNINILNRIFTRNTFHRVIDVGSDDVYSSAIRRYVLSYDGKTNKELISEIYTQLKENYRNEYYYKNTLLNKLLLGIHSINTTTALTEISVGHSKADFVLINGNAVVYEIKTELDNFDRLESQVNDYYKAFDHVSVITCETGVEPLIKRVNEIAKPIGVCVLQKNNKIKTIRKPECYNKDINVETIFKVLRKREYERILLDFFGELPQVSQIKYYKECQKMFVDMPIEHLYKAFINCLKQRVIIEKDEFAKVPYELKFLAYFMELRKSEYHRLEVFLNKQFGGV